MTNTLVDCCPRVCDEQGTSNEKRGVFEQSMLTTPNVSAQRDWITPVVNLNLGIVLPRLCHRQRQEIAVKWSVEWSAPEGEEQIGIPSLCERLGNRNDFGGAFRIRTGE